MMTTTLTHKHQVTLPPEIVQALDLTPGMQLDWTVGPDGTLIGTPQPSRAQRAAALYGAGRKYLRPGADPVRELIAERVQDDDAYQAMKTIHYDAEGDILSVTFAESSRAAHTGIELADNIVLYYNPDTGQPLALILVSYQAMVRASEQTPIVLDGLARTPAKVRATILALLQRAPLTAFLQVADDRGKKMPTGRLFEIFTPATLQMVAVS